MALAGPAAATEPAQTPSPATPSFTDREAIRFAVRHGLIAGITIVFLAMVGMIEKFEARRLIHDVVTLGKLLLSVPPFLAAYLAVRPRIRGGQLVGFPVRRAMWMGLVVGAIAGVMTALLAAVLEAFGESIREIFIRATPRLVSILTFDQGVLVGSIIAVVGGAMLGAMGALLRLAPDRWRRVIFIALWVTLLFAVLQRILRPALVQLTQTSFVDRIYSSRFGGLSRAGSTAIFLLSLGVAWMWASRRGRIQQRIRNIPDDAQKGVRFFGLLAVLLLLIWLPQLIGSVLSNILGTVGIYVLMGLGLNIVVGYSGLLDLGYVAFFAVGGYFLAILTGANLVTSLGASVDPSFSANMSFYMALPIVVLIAAGIGLLIGAPVLRLRGDYLAIVTLGFGEIARVLTESRALEGFIGGAQGLRDVTDANLFGVGFRNPVNFYYLVLALVLVATYVSWRLANSRIGRAWTAMREDEQVAEAMGISTIKYKLLAFATGGAIGSLSGALFVVQINTVQPGSFTILVSITALAVIILGGMGSIPGVIVGALVLIGLPGLLSEFEEYRLLVYGAVLIAVMILRPQGLIPNVRRARELAEEDVEQDAWAKRSGDTGSEPPVSVRAGDAS
jgi:branched-chain amino acid transport system permease protein